MGGLGDSRKFGDRALLHSDTATVCKRPAFLSIFSVSALDGLAGDSLSEADSGLATGAAETTLANQMAAITLEYEVFMVTGEPWEKKMLDRTQTVRKVKRKKFSKAQLDSARGNALRLNFEAGEPDHFIHC